MLAVIYIRVSTEDQAREGYSLEVQEEKCRQRAGELGCDRVEVYHDDVTGEILNRPELMMVLERLKQGGVDYFICYDPDRLARSLMNQLVITEKVEKAKVKIDFINFEWKNTPDGKLFYQLRGSIAEFEKAKILMRTNDGKRKKAEKGLLTHNPRLYGYSFDKEKDILSINNKEARVLRMMYSWVLEAGPGQYVGPYAVARRLNDMGIPPPREPMSKDKEALWHRATVRRILTNETYTGVLHLRVEDSTGVKNNRYRPQEEKIFRKKRPREDWCSVQVPPIIDRQSWDEVQYRLRDARRVRPGKAIEQYMLSGMVQCGVPGCGHTMHGNRIKKKSKAKDHLEYYRYYVCTAKSPGITGVDRCVSSNAPAERIENIVWDKVAGWLADPQVLAKELKDQGLGDNLKFVNDEIMTVGRLIEEANIERARIIRGYQKGTIPEEEADRILLGIKDRIGRMEKRLEELNGESRRQQLMEEEQQALREAVDEFAGRLEELTFEEKQYVIRLLVDKVIVEGRNIIIKGRIPGIFPGISGPVNSVYQFDNGNRTLGGGAVQECHPDGRDHHPVQRPVVRGAAVELHIVAPAQHSLTNFSHESGLAYPRPSLDYKYPGGVRLNDVVVKGMKALAGVSTGENLLQPSHAHQSITPLK